MIKNITFKNIFFFLCCCIIEGTGSGVNRQGFPKGFPLKTPHHLLQLLAIRNLIANSAHSFIFVLVLQLLTKALKINLENIPNNAEKNLSCMDISSRCLNHLNRGISHTFFRHNGAENFLCAVGNYVLISNNCSRCRGIFEGGRWGRRGRILLKNLRASLFNQDLLLILPCNHIHLERQCL